MWVDPCRGGLDVRPRGRVILVSALLLSLCLCIFCQVHVLFCHSSCHSSFTSEPSYCGLPVWTKDQGFSGNSQIFSAISGLGRFPAGWLSSYWALDSSSVKIALMLRWLFLNRPYLSWGLGVRQISGRQTGKWGSWQIHVFSLKHFRWSASWLFTLSLWDKIAISFFLFLL